MSPLHLAAKYGRDPRADCGRQYDGCFLDVLHALHGAVDYFLKRKHNVNATSSLSLPNYNTELRDRRLHLSRQMFNISQWGLHNSRQTSELSAGADDTADIDVIYEGDL